GQTEGLHQVLAVEDGGQGVGGLHPRRLVGPRYVPAMERLVVVGGDAAGMSAASQARKRRGPDDLSIVAFERGRATSYSACGIPYWIAGTVSTEAELISRSPEKHQANGIDVRVRHEVVGIDL